MVYSNNQMGMQSVKAFAALSNDLLEFRLNNIKMS